MEMADADYKSRTENNQIMNDVISPGGGKDLSYFVEQELLIKMRLLKASWFFKVFIKKLFNKNYQPEYEKSPIDNFKD